MSEPAENFNPAEPVVSTPKPPRKTRRRRAAPRKAKVVPFKAPGEFAGLTKLECCAACVGGVCYISGTHTCFHPLKSGMQSSADPVVVARYSRAKRVLEHQHIDLSKDIV